MQADTVAPTQSAPQPSQTQPISYAAPAAVAPSQAPQAVSTTNQWATQPTAVVAPAPQVQAQMGVAPTQYSPTPFYPQAAPSVAPQAENPYKEAFNKVVGALSSPVQLPFLGQQSNQTSETVQANYNSPQLTPYNNQGQPISQPGINSNQGYSNVSSQASQEITQEQLLANGVSPESLEIIDHFGPDSAAVLNNYACQIEDSLIQTDSQLKESVGLLQELNNEHKIYEKILTDPDILADYTVEFFGKNGPYPIPEQQPTYQQVGQRTPQVAPQQPAPQLRAEQQQFQRPQMPVPPQPQAPENTGDFWNNFGNLAERDPQNAWRYLNAQSPETFRSKMLVME
jgi:hypothetical protein